MASSLTPGTDVVAKLESLQEKVMTFNKVFGCLTIRIHYKQLHHHANIIDMTAGDIICRITASYIFYATQDLPHKSCELLNNT